MAWKIRKFDHFYSVVLVAFVLGTLSGKMLPAQLIVAVVSIIGLLSGCVPIYKIGLVALIMPSELWVYIIFVIVLLYRKGNISISFPKVNRNDRICLAIIFFLGLTNALYSGQVFNFLFYVVYLGLLVMSLLVFRSIYAKQNIRKDIQSIIKIEFIIVVIQALQARSLRPDDNFRGTLHDAHVFGVWLLLAITYLFITRNKRGRKEKHLGIPIVMAIICLYLSDAKHVIIAYVCGFALYYVISKLSKRRNTIAVSISVVIILLYMGTYLISGPAKGLVIRALDNKNTYSIYFYDPEYSYKFSYIKGTLFEELTGIRFFTGFGLGQYGSRGANLFAYDVTYRNNNEINNLIAKLFSPSSIIEYRRYASLYNDEVAAIATNRSAVLTYPFSSLIAFLAENGFVGCVCWIYLINKFFKRSRLKALIVFFAVLCFFDLYIDRVYTVCMLMIVLYSGELKNEESSIYYTITSSRRCGKGNLNLGK